MSDSTTDVFELTGEFSTKSKAGKLPVIELFGPTVQGEGQLIGVPTHFVRLGGCPYRCTWCDSMHAVDPEQVKKNATWMNPHDIMTRLAELPAKNKGLMPHWVTISGGDPVIWDCTSLVRELNTLYNVAIETEGYVYRPWLKEIKCVTVSPKPPSSGMIEKLRLEILEEYIYHINADHLFFKIVVFDEADWDFARWLRGKYPAVKFFLSVGTDSDPQGIGGPFDSGMILERYKWLVEKALSDPNFAMVRVFPQMHVLLWGHEKGR